MIHIWNPPTEKQLARIPRLYETEGTPLAEKVIYEHFFIGNSDWFIAEYDGEDLFFGYAILGGDDEMAEWGYVSYNELRELSVPPASRSRGTCTGSQGRRGRLGR